MLLALATHTNARAEETQKWATETNDQTQWIRASESIYTNTPKNIPIESDKNSPDYMPPLPQWITKALRNSHYKVNPGTFSTLAYQVFSNTENTRTIIFSASTDKDCQDSGNGNDESLPTPVSCRMHALTVKTDGTTTPLTSAKGCYFDATQRYRYDASADTVAEVKKKNGVYYRYNPTKHAIEQMVVVDGHPDKSCDSFITIPTN